MQILLPAYSTSAPLQMSQPPMQSAQNEKMEPCLIAMESGRPLIKTTSHSFFKILLLSIFLQMRILLCSVLSSIPKLCYVVGGPRAPNRGQTRIDDLLCILEGFDFDRLTQERAINSRQGAENLFKTRRSTTEAKRLRERLDKSNDHYYQMHIQFCSTKNTLGHEESKFSALGAEHCCMTNERH